MYVIVDKLNHCTAFTPKRSPWDNKYTHADIQVSLSDGLLAEIRRAELSGNCDEDAPGPGGSGAPPAGGSGQCTREKNTKTFEDEIQDARRKSLKFHQCVLV